MKTTYNDMVESQLFYALLSFRSPNRGNWIVSLQKIAPHNETRLAFLWPVFDDLVNTVVSNFNTK